MKYVSVCSGIEAASVAWGPLGWKPVLFSEIEAFPRAVLQHHYPDVPLIGDFTQLIPTEDNPNPIPIPEADLLVGGCPCQSFSVAGKRLSLEDYRGNLTLAFADLYHAGSFRYAIFENVPGILNTKDNAFGGLLGRLVGADSAISGPDRGKWPRAGVVAGPVAVAAWRVLDAQFFGVAQRRRRVFVCVSRGAGFQCARALLPVGESLSRHPPARPQKGEGIAADAPSGAPVGFNWESVHHEDAREGLAQTLKESSSGCVVPGREVMAPITSRMCQSLGPRDVEEGAVVIGALDTECGFTKATDQTVRNGHILAVPVPQDLRNREGKPGGGKGPLISENQSLTLATNNDQVVFAVGGEHNVSVGHQPVGPLLKGSPTGGGRPLPAVFVNVAPTLSASNDPSRAPQSSEVTQQVAAVLAAMDPHNASLDSVMPTLGTNTGGMGAGAGGVLQLRPRRLTPEECEKLQGFPVGWTNIPWKKGMSPDGPRYKALGNSMAVPVMAYIGKRIQLVEDGQC